MERGPARDVDRAGRAGHRETARWSGRSPDQVTRFHHFVAIDWSGARGQRQKGIAIAICHAGARAPRLVEPQRRWSREEVLDWLVHQLPPDSIVGLDLSPGLPFEEAGGYFPGWDASPSDGPKLWQLVDAICEADPHLAATSFVQHPQARHHFRHGKDDCGKHFTPGTGRLRVTEQGQKQHRLSPSSCFNLVGAAQVGKSSLTGMRLLNRLGGKLPVWPFDPLPPSGSVIVEIYTSLAARTARLPPGRSKVKTAPALDVALAHLGSEAHAPLARYDDHATDAILTAAWLRRAAHEADLWSPVGLTPEIARTEGWTFGVS